MIVDCHAHLVPASLLDAIRAAHANFPSVKLIEEGGSLGFAFAGNKPTRPVSKPLSDIAARLQWLDTNGIERQVVGGWLDMFGYEIPAEEGLRWSRLINKHLSRIAKEQPRFIPLATVPLQDGARAAEVLKEAHDQGFKGAMIGTQPKGRGGVLDDPSLLPFWEAANGLGSIVFIHPVFESGDDLARAPSVLTAMLALPAVAARLAARTDELAVLQTRENGATIRVTSILHLGLSVGQLQYLAELAKSYEFEKPGPAIGPLPGPIAPQYPANSS